MQLVTDISLLSSLYNLYAPCWQEWCQYRFCGLNAQDKTTLEQLNQNNFDADGQSLNPYLLNALYTKLKRSYPHYQEWVFMKFCFSLMNLFDKNLNEHYFNLPIKKLPLEDEEKLLLRAFGARTINQLISRFSEKDFKQPHLFGLVLRFYSSQLLTKTINHENIKAS